MRTGICNLGTVALALLVSFVTRVAAEDFAAELPSGVRAVWDLSLAGRETTPTRERICLNGLWRWQPDDARTTSPPTGTWGFFKVPGCWPGISDYMQSESQSLHAHPVWKDVKLSAINSAWYEREMAVPLDWAGRGVVLEMQSLNSMATVFVDGVQAGELRFPGGQVDITAACRPGTKQRLSLRVQALPLKGVLLSYTDTASAREVKGAVARKGLCGDVFLTGTAIGPALRDARVETSVRKGEISVSVALDGLILDGHYRVRANVLKAGPSAREFSSGLFQARDLKEGRLKFVEKWMPEHLWDLDTPGHQLELKLSLEDAAGAVLDVDWTRRFGFRELWIQGRDFYLNGTRLFLSAVPLDNAQVSAGLASYAAARESLQRLKDFGINYVYTHNYSCEPGSHLDFTEILRAADDVGMLVGFTQPHFSHYDWAAPGADSANGYAGHAAYYARVAGSHPSVVMYVMSHNATGYDEDMNPDMIDGIQDGRDQWAARNVKLALRAESLVKQSDPSRIIYHHASGNLGVMHDSNFYPNFAPSQELDDWFEHWATEGIKPAFTCEYGAPFTWDWTMYRGWYKGQREWGSAQVPWEFCLAEWNAQFFGDHAYRISEAEKANLRWESAQVRGGKVWHRWDYPNQVGSDRFEERYPVFAKYLTDNWRAYRTWGVSGISPWEYEHFWKPRPGVDRKRVPLAVDWDHLQKPGFSADFIDPHFERMDMTFERNDWIATPAAQALLRNNRPLLAYIAGKPGMFTEKGHNYLPGETVEKQVVVINNSRQAQSCETEWSIDLQERVTGRQTVTVPTGEQARLPIGFRLPKDLAPGPHQIRLAVRFTNGEAQDDRFEINVLQKAAAAARGSPIPKVLVFDPLGETTRLLGELGIRSEPIPAGAKPSRRDILVIGKGALTLDGAAPDLGTVRDGLRVIVFEQTSDALEKRLGFRVQEYGLRQLFRRVPDHATLLGLQEENLRDWHGSATIIPPRLNYEMRSRYGPTIQRSGIPQTRVWRCGNRGNVASVLIEKPAQGDFLPLLDGGFSLQYTPLLEYREGSGMVLFCQLDVTGRTERDPAAEAIVRNLFRYLVSWHAQQRRPVIYVGEAAGREHLESIGLTVHSPGPGRIPRDSVLVIGPGCATLPPRQQQAAKEFVQAGGQVLAIGLAQADADALLPFHVTLKKQEHISSFFEPPRAGSIFQGIGAADTHNRDPLEIPLLTAGAEILGDGLLAEAGAGKIAFLQLPPWKSDGLRQPGSKRTLRRLSFLFNRLVANAGAACESPLLARFAHPVADANVEHRWTDGLYSDQPEEWDDPYRFFRW